MNHTWHQHLIRVLYQDTDQMAVAHHGNYVGWFEIGRTEMMRAVGIAYKKMESLGLLLPVVDMNIHYHRPARYDECLAIYTKITTYSAVRLEFSYEVRKVDDVQSASNRPQDRQFEVPIGELLASGSTLHMWLNNKWKPARIDKAAPEVFELLNNKMNNKE